MSRGSRSGESPAASHPIFDVATDCGGLRGTPRKKGDAGVVVGPEYRQSDVRLRSLNAALYASASALAWPLSRTSCSRIAASPTFRRNDPQFQPSLISA